ncbi:MAG: dihydroneopterin aldolase [Dysgonamonadaceae bacterium]|jgi:dihydroneopterin aldolase|nr:dihydroneopterin aldolase [Dysgonamonadaceae bacterium]
MAKNIILLEGMKFYAYHGVLEQEKILGNHYTIDLKIRLDLSKASQSDNLNDTVSYADIYAVVKDEMAIPSQLLEHVAGRIIKKLETRFPAIEKVRIKLSKHNPPIGGEVEKATIII